jgi:translation initiation factor IF-2
VVAGPYCSGTGASFHQNGWFSSGTSGWTSHDGGWSADQCNGTFSSVPMSGDAGKDDGNSVIWTFTGLRTASGSCDIAVYIPAGSNVQVVGGNPTYYTVQTGTSPNSGTIGSFTIKQVANQGSWVSVGSYAVSNGQLSVMMHTRGLDWSGSSKTYAHHAADAVRATCQS